MYLSSLVTRGVALGLVVGLCLVACANRDDGPTHHAGGAGGATVAGAMAGTGAEAGGPGAAECVEGKPCDCAGLIGTCDPVSKTCDCSDCPAVPRADEPGAFEACGGDPFGTWGAAKLDASTLSWAAFGEEEGLVVCPIVVPDLTQPAFTLKLEEGGTGSLSNDFLVTTGFIAESCLQEKLGVGCSDQPGCAPGPCGTCSCEAGWGAGDASELFWRRYGANISIEGNAVQLNYSYCVKGNTLSLKDESSGLVVALTRGFALDSQTDCVARELSECEGQGRGCHVGSCDGDNETCIFNLTQQDCSDAGCLSWDPTRCGGRIRPCTYQDWDHTPGCNFLPNAVCTKSAYCNEQLSIEACFDVRCQWSTSRGCEARSGKCATVKLDDCVAAGCEVIPG